MRFSLVSVLFLCGLILPISSSAQEVDCLKCHAKLRQNKVVHPAMDMGCTACHTGIDASKVPHQKTNAFSRGLSADQPDLCYGCHDKAIFTKKNVHPAVSMGCTGCHNPHSSPNPRMLQADVPDLCFSCHDKIPFSAKIVHAPVAAGMCLSCHSPHSSDMMALLLKKPVDVCLECHPDIPKKPHAVTGFSTGSHPIGLPPQVKKGKKGKEPQKEQEVKILMDPARPDKPFYCGSCHNPHSSDSGRLFRFGARSPMDLCTNCHKM